MFAKPNEAVVRSLARLNTQEFDHLTGFLDEELAIIKTHLVTAPPDKVEILQGRARELDELLALIRKAPEMRG